MLAGRGDDVPKADVEESVYSFIVPLDPHRLALQELAVVLACSDRRYLPDRYRTVDRAQRHRRPALRVADASGSTICQFVDGPV